MRTALILSALAAFATPAAAEPYERFKALCLDADSDPAVTEQAARSMNWVPAPAELVAQFPIDSPELVGFVSDDPAIPTAADGEFVMAYRGLITDPADRNVDIFMCVMGGRSSFSETQSRIEGWLGTGGVDDEGVVNWVYTLTAGVPESAVELAMQGEDAMAELARQKPIYLLKLTNEGDGLVGLFLGVTRIPL